MTRFQQLGIPATSPWRYEVAKRGHDGVLRSLGAYKSAREAADRAIEAGAEVRDRAAPGSAEGFPSPSSDR